MFNKILLATSLLFTITLTNAGIYQDKLSECLSKSTTAEERQNLTAWIYLAFSAHPEIAKYNKATPDEVAKIDKNMAKLFQDLLTTRCKAEIKAVTENEGTNALANAFELLGKTAAESLMQNPAVNTRISAFTKYFDEEAIRKSMK